MGAAAALIPGIVGIAGGQYQQMRERDQQQAMERNRIASAGRFLGQEEMPQRNSMGVRPPVMESQMQSVAGGGDATRRALEARSMSGKARQFALEQAAYGNKGPLEAMIASQLNPKTPEQFNLGENEKRFDENGNLIAFNPGAPKERALTDLEKLISARDALSPTDPNWRLYNAAISKQTKSDGDSESWSNPVTEIGQDGKPISVRYGSKGGRRVVDGATPARQGNSFDRQDYWRNTFKPELGSATNTYAQSAKVKNSLALDSGLGDIAAINALQKQIDEGAVVRDQDVQLVQSAQSLTNTLSSQMENLKSGKKLSADLRKQLQSTSDALSKAIYAGVKQKIEPYTPTMVQEGVDIKNIVPPSLQKAYGWTDQTENMSDSSYDFAGQALGGGWSVRKQ